MLSIKWRAELRKCGSIPIAFDILSISMYSNELRNCGTAELQSRLDQVCIAFDILSIIIYSLFEFYKITKWKNLLIQSFNNTINTVWFNVDEKYNTKNYNMTKIYLIQSCVDWNIFFSWLLFQHFMYIFRESISVLFLDIPV